MAASRPTSVIPAQEHVKKSATRLKSGQQRRPRAGGDPYKSLFQLDEWIPAFAGMTLRGLTEGCNFDFFTRSQAGIHVSKKHCPFMGLPWVPAFAGRRRGLFRRAFPPANPL